MFESLGFQSAQGLCEIGFEVAGIQDFRLP